ncbi:MAG: dTMP kinase [Firmicutes bacterium]|nr:dTMP kinase [Bacillota bacterium]
MKKGLFVTLEGLDGAGKSTQIKLLVERAQSLGLETVTAREPGGTDAGDAIRAILLNPRFCTMTALTEAFLYAASRAQLVHEVIAPALASGKLVICDRFLDSSLAYQAAGGGLDFDFVLAINRKAVQECMPDRTYILDLQPEVGQKRRGEAAADRVEQKPLAYHRRVREGFLQLAEFFPERIRVLDAARPPDELFARIWEDLAPLLKKMEK